MKTSPVLQWSVSVVLSVFAMNVCEAELTVDRPVPLLPRHSVDSPVSDNAAPKEVAPQKPLQLELEIRDGSLVIGTPCIDSISLQTSYAKMDIKLARIISMKIGDDHKTVAIALRNGDKLSGAVTLEAIKITALFGKATIGIDHIEELRVLLSHGSMPAALKQSLVLHYSFDRDEGGRATDKSGHKNNGTINNGTLVEDAWMRRGLKLDGENDYVHIPNSESLEIRKELTICTWARIKSFGPGGYGNEHGFIVNKGNSMWWNPAFHLGYAKGSGSVHPRWPAKPGPYPALFHVCNSTGVQRGGGKTVKSVTQLVTGKWYHLAGTYDGEQVKIYINGKLEDTAKYTGPLRSDNAPVLIGGSKLGGTGWGNQFTSDATIDEVMIFNRALTDAEVQTVYRVKPRD